MRLIAIPTMPLLITIWEDACVTYPCISVAQSIYVSSKQYYNYRINQQSMIKNKATGYDWNKLNYVYDCLLKNLNQKEYDFTPQINRYFCHALFNIAVSHLRTNRVYNEVKKEIIFHLKLKENIKFLDSAKFKIFSKDFFAQNAVKYHQIWFLKLYAVFLLDL